MTRGAKSNDKAPASPHHHPDIFLRFDLLHRMLLVPHTQPTNRQKASAPRGIIRLSVNFSITAFIGKHGKPLREVEPGKPDASRIRLRQRVSGAQNRHRNRQDYGRLQTAEMKLFADKRHTASRILMALVRAAKNRRMKNTSPNSLPPGKPANTSGSAIKATLPPESMPQAFLLPAWQTRPE